MLHIQAPPVSPNNEAWVHARIRKDDFDLVKDILPSFGNATRIVNIIISTLADKFRAANITHYNPSDEPIIRQIITDTLGRRALDGVVETDVERDDRGGTPQIHPTEQVSPSELERGGIEDRAGSGENGNKTKRRKPPGKQVSK